MTRVIDPNPQPGQPCLFTPQTCDHLSICNTGLTPQQIININNDPNHIIKALISVQNRSKTFASNSLEFGIYPLMNNLVQGQKIIDKTNNVIENEVIEDDFFDIIYGRGHKYWYSFIDTISQKKGNILGIKIVDSLTNSILIEPTKLNLNRQLFLSKYLSSVPNLYERMKFTESRIWTQSDKAAYIGDTTKVDSIFLEYMSPLILSVLKNQSNGLIDYRLLSVPLPGEVIEPKLFNGDTVGTPPLINVDYNSNSEFNISIANVGTHSPDSPISLSFVWGDGTSTEDSIMPNNTKLFKHNYLHIGKYRVVIYAQNTCGLRSVFLKNINNSTVSIPDQLPSFDKSSFSIFKVFSGPLSNVGYMYFDILGVNEIDTFKIGNTQSINVGYGTTKVLDSLVVAYNTNLKPVRKIIISPKYDVGTSAKYASFSFKKMKIHIWDTNLMSDTLIDFTINKDSIKIYDLSNQLISNNGLILNDTSSAIKIFFLNDDIKISKIEIPIPDSFWQANYVKPSVITDDEIEGLFVETKPDRFFKYTLSSSIKPVNYNHPKVTVYPNPTVGNIVFLRENTSLSEGQFLITDLAGQVQLSTAIAQNQNIFEVDVNFLQPGLYLWTFNCKNFQQSGKIVKLNNN